MHKSQFIHIAQTDQITGQIVYHSFPRLVHFNLDDPLKKISFEIFRAMDSMVPRLRNRKPLSEAVDEPLANYNRFNEMFISNDLS